MGWTTLFLHASILLVISLHKSRVHGDLDSDYTNSAYLDEARTFKLYWKINNDQKRIWFAARVKTLGWVGFGISAGNGNMVGSDVVIGWVKDNKGHLKDRFAGAKALPPIDDEQNYDLIQARESNGETIIEFSRLWNTCDKKDNKIEEGTVRVVYAYHTDDPTSETDVPIHTKRGSRSLILLNILMNKPSLPSDAKYFDFLQNDTAVPSEDTTYYCKPFEFPQFPSKKHVVKIEPIISPGNEGLVHHMLVYECNSDFTHEHLNVSGLCGARNMPPAVRRCAGSAVVASWGIGGTSFYFPDHTGFAVGAGVGPRYAVLEVHYDNPMKKTGLRDSSGLRFYYTATLRKYDAGILWAGWDVNWLLMLPPHQDEWTSIGYCSRNCTEIGFQNSTLPDKGINIFATLLHSHLQGTALLTKHVRDGKELPEIARDDHYDFNYQEFHISKNETHVLPGDDIIQICKYQSKGKDKVIFGGFRSSEEMCMSFLYYYPKVELNKCLSRNIGSWTFLTKNFMVNGSIVGFPPANWTSEMSVELKNYYNQSQYINTRCRYQGGARSPAHDKYVLKPVIDVPYKKEPEICATRPPPTTPPDTGVNGAGVITVDSLGLLIVGVTLLVSFYTI